MEFSFSVLYCHHQCYTAITRAILPSPVLYYLHQCFVTSNNAILHLQDLQRTSSKTLYVAFKLIVSRNFFEILRVLRVAPRLSRVFENLFFCVQSKTLLTPFGSFLRSRRPTVSQQESFPFSRDIFCDVHGPRQDPPTIKRPTTCLRQVTTQHKGISSRGNRPTTL